MKPHVAVIGRMSSALGADAVTAVTGTYGALCSLSTPAGGPNNHDATDPWVYDASGVGTTLSVVKNDSDCVLTVREIVAAGVTYSGAPAIALDTSYQASASRFELSGGALGFYGNAKIDGLSFASDFEITVLLSADPAATYNGGQQAGFETHSASVTQGTVAAPDYTINCLTIGMQEDVSHVVQSVSAYAELTAHSVVGQDYAIVAGGLEDATFDEVDVAFQGSVIARGALADLSPELQLATASFDVVGADLDIETERTVIIRNTVSGVSSYQLMVVTFNP